jgi:hypothetical protein
MLTLILIPQLKATQEQILKALFLTLAIDTVIFLSCFV